MLCIRSLHKTPQNPLKQVQMSAFVGMARLLVKIKKWKQKTIAKQLALSNFK